jgi:hypothetical protein
LKFRLPSSCPNGRGGLKRILALCEFAESLSNIRIPQLLQVRDQRQVGLSQLVLSRRSTGHQSTQFYSQA